MNWDNITSQQPEGKTHRGSPLAVYTWGRSVGPCSQLPSKAGLVAAARKKHSHEARLSCHLQPAHPKGGWGHQGAPRAPPPRFRPGWVPQLLLWPKGRGGQQARSDSDFLSWCQTAGGAPHRGHPPLCSCWEGYHMPPRGNEWLLVSCRLTWRHWLTGSFKSMWFCISNLPGWVLPACKGHGSSPFLLSESFPCDDPELLLFWNYFRPSKCGLSLTTDGGSECLITGGVQPLREWLRDRKWWLRITQWVSRLCHELAVSILSEGVGDKGQYSSCPHWATPTGASLHFSVYINSFNEFIRSVAFLKELEATFLSCWIYEYFEMRTHATWKRESPSKQVRHCLKLPEGWWAGWSPC